MNPRTFLQEFEESADRDRLVDVVYDEMAGYCMDNNITEDEISTPMLEALAEGVVKRGLGIRPSEETKYAKGRYRSQDFEDGWIEQLGEASDGTESDRQV